MAITPRSRAIIEDSDWMAQHGEIVYNAIQRLNNSRRYPGEAEQTFQSLERLLYRHGRSDIVERFKTNGEYNNQRYSDREQEA